MSNVVNKKTKPATPLSLYKLHNKLVFIIYCLFLIPMCLSNLPTQTAIWRIAIGGTLGAISTGAVSQSINSRSSHIFRSVLLGLSVLFHLTLLDGYKSTNGDFVTAIVLHLIVIIVFACCYKRSPGYQEGDIRNVQGARMYSPDRVQQLRGVTEIDINKCYNFASIFLPFEMFSKHHFILGMSGSGKSIWLNTMMFAFFNKEHTKGIVHDYAVNMTGNLASMGVSLDRIVNTNPLQELGTGWLLSDDAVGKSASKEAGMMPFPIKPNDSGNSFFPKASADMTGSVIYVLYRLAKDSGVDPFFDWSDVINCCLSRERLYAVLSLYPDTRAAFSYLRSDGETNDSLMSTLRTGLQQYEAIAAAGHRAIKEGRIFSAARWIESNQILLMGRETKRAKKAMQNYNATIVNVLVRTILARQVSDITPDPYIGLFIDEFANFGKIEDIVDLGREARRHGVSMNFANQELLPLQEKYGRGEFNSITGQINNWIFLALNDPDTQKAAADLVGKTKYEKLTTGGGESHNYSYNSGKDGGSSSRSKGSNTNWSWKDVEEYLVMPSAFQGLSKVDFNSQRPMQFVAKIDNDLNFETHLYPQDLLAILPPKNDAYNHLNNNPVPAEWEDLEPLTVDDLKRLCLPLDIFAFDNFDDEPPLLEGLEPLEMDIKFDDDDEEDDEPPMYSSVRR